MARFARYAYLHPLSTAPAVGARVRGNAVVLDFAEVLQSVLLLLFLVDDREVAFGVNTPKRVAIKVESFD